MDLTSWLPEHSAALRDLRARGMSYGAIAEAINAKFNTNYSRDATLSRGQRMGLATLERPEPSLPRRPNIDRLPETSVEPKTSGEPKGGLFRWPKSFGEKLEAPNLRCVDIVPRHLSLLDLESKDCRYPYGGDSDGEPITFCGHPRRPGSRYCTPHFHLSRNPELQARPVLCAGWLRAVGAD